MPLAQERYHLVCLKSALAQPGTLALLDVLRSSAWHAELGQVAGYAPQQSGQVLSMRQVLPWWNFARAKPRRLDKAPTQHPRQRQFKKA